MLIIHSTFSPKIRDSILIIQFTANRKDSEVIKEVSGVWLGHSPEY